MPILAGIISWLHISAAVFTVGGITFILLTLRPATMAALEPPTVGKLMGQIALRFRWVVWLAMVYRGLTGPSDAMTTSYGRTLLIKALLSLVLFASALLTTLPMKRLAWFRARALTFQRLNAALAFIIILLATLMVRAGGIF